MVACLKFVVAIVSKEVADNFFEADKVVEVVVEADLNESTTLIPEDF